MVDFILNFASLAGAVHAILILSSFSYNTQGSGLGKIIEFAWHSSFNEGDKCCSVQTIHISRRYRYEIIFNLENNHMLVSEKIKS